jgi:hypothetical protein
MTRAIKSDARHKASSTSGAADEIVACSLARAASSRRSIGSVVGRCCSVARRLYRPGRMVRLGFEPWEGSCLFCLKLLVGVGLPRRCRLSIRVLAAE